MTNPIKRNPIICGNLIFLVINVEYPPRNRAIPIINKWFKLKLIVFDYSIFEFSLLAIIIMGYTIINDVYSNSMF